MPAASTRRMQGTQRRRLHCNALWCPLNQELYKNIIDKKGRTGLTLATTWMNREDTELSEISQLRKDTCCVSPFIRGTEGSRMHRERQKNVGCQGLGGRGRRAIFV